MCAGGPVDCSVYASGSLPAVNEVWHHVNERKQEEPDDVNEVPVPGSKFEAEMLLSAHAAHQKADQADRQEDRTDYDVRTVEAGRHEEGGTIQRPIECELGVAIFVSLQQREHEAEDNRKDQAVACAGTVAMLKGVVSPGYSCTGQQKDQRVDQWQMEGIERLNTDRRPIVEASETICVECVRGIPSFADACAFENCELKEAPEPSREEHDF